MYSSINLCLNYTCTCKKTATQRGDKGKTSKTRCNTHMRNCLCTWCTGANDDQSWQRCPASTWPLHEMHRKQGKIRHLDYSPIPFISPSIAGTDNLQVFWLPSTKTCPTVWTFAVHEQTRRFKTGMLGWLKEMFFYYHMMKLSSQQSAWRPKA